MTDEVLAGQAMADMALAAGGSVRTPPPGKPLHDTVRSFIPQITHRVTQVATTPSTPCSLPHCAGPPSMHTYILPPECNQCVTDCDMTSCDAGATQCTYRCAVVPCMDPSSCVDACQDCTSFDLECDAEGCPFFADEVSGAVLGLAVHYYKLGLTATSTACVRVYPFLE